MASHFVFIFVFIFFLFTHSNSNPILPKALFIPIAKHPSTHYYIAKISIHRSQKLDLVLDLNSPYIWTASHFPPPSSPPIRTSSLECSMVQSIHPTICSLLVHNAVSGISTPAQVYQSTIHLNFWDGIHRYSSSAEMPDFLLPFALNSSSVEGLFGNATGVLGLGYSRISLPSQLFMAFPFLNRKFSLHLPHGLFFGGNPNSNPNSMIYTPLIRRAGSSHYSFNVKAIKVSDKKLPFSLQQPKEARISTLAPYTTLGTHIYRSFIELYIEAARTMNLSVVKPPVAPFGACFESKSGGGAVPEVEFLLQSEMVKWRIRGKKNLMVDVSEEVMCVGIVDGGLVEDEDIIVIGGLQLEDHVLEFDLGNSMLGIGHKSFLQSHL